MLPSEEEARYQSEFCIAVDIANFRGDVKLFLRVAYWIHLIHIQLGTLGLREIDARGPEIRLLPSWWYAAAAAAAAAAIEEETVRRLY